MPVGGSAPSPPLASPTATASLPSPSQTLSHFKVQKRAKNDILGPFNQLKRAKSMLQIAAKSMLLLLTPKAANISKVHAANCLLKLMGPFEQTKGGNCSNLSRKSGARIRAETSE
ncbi:MAG: hypothetical protein WA405_00420 [Candidatus Acidiferrales bacterium]